MPSALLRPNRKHLPPSKRSTLRRTQSIPGQRSALGETTTAYTTRLSIAVQTPGAAYGLTQATQPVARVSAAQPGKPLRNISAS